MDFGLTEEQTELAGLTRKILAERDAPWGDLAAAGVLAAGLPAARRTHAAETALRQGGAGLESRDALEGVQKLREAYSGARTEDAFSRFELLERRADFAEGRADALGMTGPKSLEEEIAELQASEKVDAELEAMKAALKNRGK